MMHTDQEVQTRYRNFYQCSDCGTKWTDEWDCACNDRCPKSAARQSHTTRSKSSRLDNDNFTS